MPRHSEDTPTDPTIRDAKEPARARDHADAIRGRTGSREPKQPEAPLVSEAAMDEAIEMTFPASDPPAWTSSRIDPQRGRDSCRRSAG